MIKDIALIGTELAEAIEAIREGRTADFDFNTDIIVTNWKESFEEEIADTFIRLFDFCGNYSIDIETYINKKMKYNESREHLHGKKL